MSNEIKAIIDTTLKAEILKALNSVPEAIEALVKAALEQDVYELTGTPSPPQYGSYGAVKLPYLDYAVGTQIRHAATAAVREAVAALQPQINAEVAKRLNAETIVNAFAEQITKTVQEDWRMTIRFEADKKD